MKMRVLDEKGNVLMERQAPQRRVARVTNTRVVQRVAPAPALHTQVWEMAWKHHRIRRYGFHEQGRKVCILVPYSRRRAYWVSIKKAFLWFIMPPSTLHQRFINMQKCKSANQSLAVLHFCVSFYRLFSVISSPPLLSRLLRLLYYSRHIYRQQCSWPIFAEILRVNEDAFVYARWEFLAESIQWCVRTISFRLNFYRP